MIFRRIFVTIGLFYGSLQSTDGSNFPTRGREGEGGGGGCRRIKALSFFSQICVNVKSSEACEPIRPTFRFMVHDIGQIYAKPHARLKGDRTFSRGGLHCCGCFAFMIPLFCISFFFFFFFFLCRPPAQCTFNGFHSPDSVPWATATPFFDLVSRWGLTMTCFPSFKAAAVQGALLCLNHRLVARRDLCFMLYLDSFIDGL